MFFFLSKLLAFVSDPFFYIWIFLFCYFVDVFVRKKSGKKWIIVLGSYLYLIGSPLVGKLVYAYETLYSKPPLIPHADVVVVLGGGNVFYDRVKDEFQFNDNFSRSFEGLRLKKKFEPIPMIFSGGEAFPIDVDWDGEAISTKHLAAETGFETKDLILENKSLNTKQNAVNTSLIMQEKSWRTCYLVTSALHMPRSVALFRKQGINVVPYPVGQLEDGKSLGIWKFSNIRNLALLLHEGIGFVAYVLMGYI